jgi:hypothetical protein
MQPPGAYHSCHREPILTCWDMHTKSHRYSRDVDPLLRVFLGNIWWDRLAESCCGRSNKHESDLLALAGKSWRSRDTRIFYNISEAVSSGIGEERQRCEAGGKKELLHGTTAEAR